LISFNDLTKELGQWWVFKSTDNKFIDPMDILPSLESISILDLINKDKVKLKITLNNLYLLNKIMWDDIKDFLRFFDVITSINKTKKSPSKKKLKGNFIRGKSFILYK
jgi:hypothetical protein